MTGAAHFFKLVIDELRSNAGAVIVTSANCTADRVDLWTNYYRVYFRASDSDGKKITNSWRVNDQAICQTFDAATGTSYNVSNKYYWRLVVGVSSSPITLSDGNEYHYIDLSRQSGNYVGTSAPEAGDNIVQLGYRGTDDNARQSAIIISAYQTPDTALAAPSLAFYQGIKTFALAAYRKTFFDATRNHFIGDFYLGPNQSLTQYVDTTVQNAVDNIDISDVTEGVFKLRPQIKSAKVMANGDISILFCYYVVTLDGVEIDEQGINDNNLALYYRRSTVWGEKLSFDERIDQDGLCTVQTVVTADVWNYANINGFTVWVEST